MQRQGVGAGFWGKGTVEGGQIDGMRSNVRSCTNFLFCQGWLSLTHTSYVSAMCTLFPTGSGERKVIN